MTALPPVGILAPLEAVAGFLRRGVVGRQIGEATDHRQRCQGRKQATTGAPRGKGASERIKASWIHSLSSHQVIGATVRVCPRSRSYSTAPPAR
jgi:hypothetical protein